MTITQFAKRPRQIDGSQRDIAHEIHPIKCGKRSCSCLEPRALLPLAAQALDKYEIDTI